MYTRYIYLGSCACEHFPAAMSFRETPQRVVRIFASVHFVRVDPGFPSAYILKHSFHNLRSGCHVVTVPIRSEWRENCCGSRPAWLAYVACFPSSGLPLIPHLHCLARSKG